MPKPKISKSQIQAARKFWRPRRPELAEPCVSCPFREGNDLEFGEIVRRLLRRNSPGERMTSEKVAQVRASVRQELKTSGEFACHGTVYDEHMRLKPREGHRQCAGAAQCYRQVKFHV